jgi:nucleoside 2-deoxyribosyltransferase
LNHAKNIFLQFLKQKKNQPDNGTYFEIGVAVLFQAAVFAFQKKVPVPGKKV